MGKVVDIESKPRRKARGRKKPSKTALVLGGGGFTGGVYEIGALRALDLLAVNSTVNNFDVYVGTSAGSFVAGMLANGVTPDEMMQVLNSREPSEMEDLDLSKVLTPNYLGFLQKAAALPLRTLELVRSLARLGELSAIDIGVGLAEALPTGLYSGSGLADYVAEVLAAGGRVNDFRLLDRELYLTATDLDTCERIVFGEDGWQRRADLQGGPVLDGAADRLQAGRPEGAPAGRRRHPLDHQRRHRGREGRQVHRRRQPARALRQRLREDDPHRLRQPRAAGLRHGPAGDRQPDLPPDRPSAPAPGGRAVAGEVPGRRHRPDRARADRRADVRHADHGLLAAPARSPATASNRSPPPWPRTTSRFEGIAKRHGLEISERRVRRVVERAAEEESEQTSAWRRVLEQTTSVLLRQSGEAS